MVIKTYNVQLLENLMYLGLHPPKHGKLYPCEKFHCVNTCHLHIGQWVNQNFIPESNSCTMHGFSPMVWANKHMQSYVNNRWTWTFIRIGLFHWLEPYNAQNVNINCWWSFLLQPLGLGPLDVKLTPKLWDIWILKELGMWKLTL
jgi:hypothetical protein